MHKSPFSNLTSFECLDSPPTTDVLAKLNESKSLTSLTLVWNGQHKLYLYRFESLKSLRVYVEGPRIWSLPSPLVAPENLTKLVVHDSGFCRWSKELVLGRYVSFPSLRVLRLDECAAEPADIFEFIQTGVDQAGKTQGYFTGCGFVPEFYESLRKIGVPLDLDIFERREPVGVAA